jgi:hypothetical protein
MDRALLEKPFEPAQIRQRKGRNGLLDYVEGHTVIARLNEAFDGAWSFEVVSHEIREEEVLVLGRLAAEGVVKMQFGASQVTRDRESKALVSLGDDLKAAATDALKKCATFLGVGLHLYGEKPLRPVAPSGARASNPNGAKPASSGDRATPRQLDAIGKVGKAKGLDGDEVDRLSQQAFGKKPEALTQIEAAALIKELSNLRRKAA